VIGPPFLPRPKTYDARTNLKLYKYNSKFTVGLDGHLRLGRGTHVDILAISIENGAEDHLSVIKSTVLLSARAKLASGHCSICERPTDPPDADSLWFVLENHDGDRLLFPSDHSVDERDRWPVPGWESTTEGDMVCPECLFELEKAKRDIKARRGK
jgi:hypothetical protein